MSIESRLLSAAECDSLDLRPTALDCSLLKLGQVDEGEIPIPRDSGTPTALATSAPLVNFADLLLQTGYSSAAEFGLHGGHRLLHPHNPKGHTNFGDLLASERNFEAARERYETASAARSEPPQCPPRPGRHLLGIGRRAHLEHLAIRFHNRPVATFPFLGTGEPTPLLVLMSANRGNLPWHDLIDNRSF